MSVFLLSKLKKHLQVNLIGFRAEFVFFFVALFQVVTAALEIAMEEDVEFRRGLPLDYLTYMGVQNSDKANVKNNV